MCCQFAKVSIVWCISVVCAELLLEGILLTPTIPCNSTLAEEAKALRDHRREEEAKQRAEQEAAAQREAEEEERKQMLDDVKKQAEAKPGMVWNQQLREYQYLHDPTQESWRD